jgi:hypothetical protein
MACLIQESKASQSLCNKYFGPLCAKDIEYSHAKADDVNPALGSACLIYSPPKGVFS